MKVICALLILVLQYDSLQSGTVGGEYNQHHLLHGVGIISEVWKLSTINFFCLGLGKKCISSIGCKDNSYDNCANNQNKTKCLCMEGFDFKENSADYECIPGKKLLFLLKTRKYLYL